MNVNLTHLAIDLSYNRDMVHAATGEGIVGPCVLIPDSEVSAAFQVWWPLSSGQWAWVTPDGVVAYCDALPAAGDLA